jgi:hypothetical protein
VQLNVSAYADYRVYIQAESLIPGYRKAGELAQNAIISQKLNANVLTFLSILVHSGFIFDRPVERKYYWVIVMSYLALV